MLEDIFAKVSKLQQFWLKNVCQIIKTFERKGKFFFSKEEKQLKKFFLQFKLAESHGRYVVRTGKVA